MKTQTENTQESQNSIAPRVARESSNGGTAQLKDNRTSTIDQRKLRETIDSYDPQKAAPVQRKVPKGSSRFQQIAMAMGEKHSVDTSGLVATHNSFFPEKLNAEATIQGNKIHFAPGKDTDYNISHEVAHAIDNTINGTPKGDQIVNGQRIDTTRENVVDRMVKMQATQLKGKLNADYGCEKGAEEVGNRAEKKDTVLSNIKESVLRQDKQPVQRTVANALANQAQYNGMHQQVVLLQGTILYHGTNEDGVKNLEAHGILSQSLLNLKYPNRRRGGEELGSGFYATRSWNQALEYEGGFILEFETTTLLNGEEVNQTLRDLPNKNGWDDDNDFIYTPKLNINPAGPTRAISQYPVQHKLTDAGIMKVSLVGIWKKEYQQGVGYNWQRVDMDQFFFLNTPYAIGIT